MRTGQPRYPVDRYLVKSSNKIEMVNIDDDLWNPEPGLRPEDELILRRLHDMLHSTAEDLKLLSGELAQYRQPGLTIKSQPVPLDEEFNEKVHIQEVVNAKFHGHRIVEQSQIRSTPKLAPKPNLNVTYSKPNVNTGVQVDSVPIVRKPPKFKNLEVTHTKILEIGNFDKNTQNKLNNGKVVRDKDITNAPAVAYNEFTYKYEEPKVTAFSQKFKIQDMPSINIRSELKEQKVLQLDIFPDNNQTENTIKKNNVAVIAAKHEFRVPEEDAKISLSTKNQTQQINTSVFPQSIATKKQLVRKVSKMSPLESSGSTNNVSSDTHHKHKTQNQIKSVLRSSPRTSARDRSKPITYKKKEERIKNNEFGRNEPDSRSRLNLDEWKKKLNVIYGQPSTSKTRKPSRPSKKSPKQTNLSSATKIPVRNVLNNAEYIPYSKLTLGGARVSDVEREIFNIPNKNDMPLSPILDKILSSRENSFNKESPRKNKNKDSPRIFTTSDENLLEEVIDLEKKVSKTIQNNMTIRVKVSKSEKAESVSSEDKDENEKDSYVDDFEEEKSDTSEPSQKEQSRHDKDKSISETNNNTSNGNDETNSNVTKENVQSRPNANQSNLSIKNSIDIFEFIHSVDRQDTATQSNTTQKISLKGTQTSPRNDQNNIHPIHNDLWPVDPKGNVEKMFKLEKDFIKKLIIEEYGDIIEKNVGKPSTSKDDNNEHKQKNVAASQKVTQTSPARVKSVMTSPARTKTRTTSPFLSVTVEHQTSPVVVVTNEENLSVEMDNGEDCISINLSSPRFSLRLPQSSRESVSNLEGASFTPSKTESVAKNNNVRKSKTYRNDVISSSSSEAVNSSELSSLGEVKFKLKRRYKKRVKAISESSEFSNTSKSSSDLLSAGVIPMRSEGEVSFKQLMKKGSNKTSKSEGEASIGRTK